MRSRRRSARASTGSVGYDRRIYLAPSSNKLHLIFLRFYETNSFFFLSNYIHCLMRLMWKCLNFIRNTYNNFKSIKVVLFGFFNFVYTTFRHTMFIFIFLSFQIYSFEREAIQVHGMWKRFLPIEDIGGTQDSTHGRVSPQMSSLQQKF